MPRFFVSPEDIFNDSVIIKGEDALHISRSLRMKEGETLVICDNNGNDYNCMITGFTKDTVYAKIDSVKKSESEAPYFITLYQGIPKGDKMDTIIQKAVECGVNRIVPVEMKNCIAKIDADSRDKKIQRWQKIANEASKQSGRGRFTEIGNPISYKEAIGNCLSDDIRFVCYENEDSVTLKDALRQEIPSSVSFFIGPEGGFDKSEILFAKDNNVGCVSIGKRILRTETAPLFVLSALSFLYEL